MDRVPRRGGVPLLERPKREVRSMSAEPPPLPHVTDRCAVPKQQPLHRRRIEREGDLKRASRSAWRSADDHRELIPFRRTRLHQNTRSEAASNRNRRVRTAGCGTSVNRDSMVVVRARRIHREDPVVGSVEAEPDASLAPRGGAGGFRIGSRIGRLAGIERKGDLGVERRERQHSRRRAVVVGGYRWLHLLPGRAHPLGGCGRRSARRRRSENRDRYERGAESRADPCVHGPPPQRTGRRIA